MSIDETLSRSSTMSIVLAKHLIGVTQHPSTIIVRVVVQATSTDLFFSELETSKGGSDIIDCLRRSQRRSQRAALSL